jgi:hypothetical protein
MINKSPFCASLRLTRTVFTRLFKKANNHLYSLPLIPGPQSLTHNSLPNMMIQSKTNNHLYGLHSFAFSLNSYGISSTKEQVRKNKLFMQNKANFQKVKLNVTKVLTKDYDLMDTWSIRKTKPIQSQLKPIQSQLKPIQSQLKPILCQYKPN